MRIGEIKLNHEQESGLTWAIASARVVFENCDRPSKTVFIKTPVSDAAGFDANPDAFLVGCLVPAMYYGEKRMVVDGRVCPLLKEGLGAAMGLLSYWYGNRFKPLHIEAPSRRKAHLKEGGRPVL